MSFKIPKHLSHKFNSLDKQGKAELISEYKAWLNNPLTEALIEDLDNRYKALVREDEREDSFITYFQSKYKSARNKAERKVLRCLIEMLNWKV